jgi:hypothetical protein
LKIDIRPAEREEFIVAHPGEGGGHEQCPKETWLRGCEQAL